MVRRTDRPVMPGPGWPWRSAGDAGDGRLRGWPGCRARQLSVHLGEVLAWQFEEGRGCGVCLGLRARAGRRVRIPFARPAGVGLGP